jgi:hypothetical protein
LRSEPLTAFREPRSSVLSRWLIPLASAIPLALAVWLWIGSLSEFDLSRMTDIGLISILPARYLLAIGFITVGFVLALRQETLKDPLLFLYLAGLIFMLHGTPQLIYGTLRYSWAWKHVAIIDYIQRHASVDPGITYLNIYHNWPGFFTLNTLLTEIAGLPSAITYAGWAPVFFNLIDLGAILLIFRSFTGDQRLTWLGAWIFFLGNWIGQDYFSPQALTYFLYLVVLAVVLNFFHDAEMPSRQIVMHFLRLDRVRWLNPPVAEPMGARQPLLSTSAPYQRVGLILMVILILVAIASSHQLTPLMLIVGLTCLALMRVFQVRSLPVLAAVITVGWMIYLAVGYFHGSIKSIVDSIQALITNFHTNLINLSISSPGQALVARMDRALTALVIVLGILGFVRRLRAGKWDLPAILLALTPLPMLAVPYGGEIIFRVYYFALPFLAFFAAGLFMPSPQVGRSIRSGVLVLATSCVMLVGFGFGYYGKELINYFPGEEVAAANYIADHAKPGTLIYSAAWDWPLQARNYEDFRYESFTSFEESYREQIEKDPVNTIAKEMANFPSAYLIITDSQKADVNMTGIMPAGSLDRIQADLTTSGRFRVVYRNADAVVFTLAGAGG